MTSNQLWFNFRQGQVLSLLHDLDMPSGNQEDACAMEKGGYYPELLKLDACLDVALGLRIYCKFSCSGA